MRTAQGVAAPTKTATPSALVPDLRFSARWAESAGGGNYAKEHREQRWHMCPALGLLLHAWCPRRLLERESWSVQSSQVVMGVIAAGQRLSGGISAGFTSFLGTRVGRPECKL